MRITASLSLLLSLALCACGNGGSGVAVVGGTSQKADLSSRESINRTKSFSSEKRVSAAVSVSARTAILDAFTAQTAGLEAPLDYFAQRLALDVMNYSALTEQWTILHSGETAQITPHKIGAYLLSLPAAPLVAWPGHLMGQRLNLTPDCRLWCSIHTALADVAATVFLGIATELRGEIIADQETARKRIWEEFKKYDPTRIFAKINERVSYYQQRDFLVELTGSPPAWQYPQDGVRVVGSPLGLMLVCRGVEQWSERALAGQTVTLTLASSQAAQYAKSRGLETGTGIGSSQKLEGSVGLR